jgi:glutamate-1-semialdehyde 2,1-aminomutase
MSVDPIRAVRSPNLGSDRSSWLRERAHQLIPGGAHTYAKGDDQFPELAPTFIERGTGCRVWDIEGNEFIEYGMGLRSVTLGHAYARVVDAASRQMARGSNYTRPAAIEVECAEALLELIPRADMVKFCKDGSTANTAAITLARAYTGRDLVAICKDDPFFAYNDWFIGVTEMNAGIPRSVRELTLGFRYNDLESVEALFATYPGQIACVILEAERNEKPLAGFLQGLGELCTQNGALFILDEMITGFRWNLGGAQAEYGLDPDLSTFGKAIANGFSVSALAGKREIMELGGLRHPGERVFLLSTTHGAESHSLAAALATIAVYREHPVIETLHERGRRLQDGLEAAAKDSGVGEFFQVVGRASNLVYVTRDSTGAASQPFRTLFLQEMIARGFLCPSLVVSYAHSQRDIDDTIEAAHEALVVYEKALANGIDGYLQGRSVKPVMRRHN